MARGEAPTRLPARVRQQGGGDADGDGVGAGAAVYPDGVQQLDVWVLLPLSGVACPMVESKDDVACWFFSHPTLNNK